MSGSTQWPVVAVGESLLCLAEHAMVWPAERTLFVADVHLGKAASFRAAGVPLPSGHSSHDLDRLSTLIDTHKVSRLVILGDLVHTQTSYTEALDRKFRGFRRRHESIEMLLVRGNHDLHAGDPPPDWGLKTFAGPLTIGPFACCHEPPGDDVAGYALAGHLHPAVRLQTAREGVTLPCFWQHVKGMVLPAFGSLTGKYTVHLKSDESAIVIAGTRLHHIEYRG